MLTQKSSHLWVKVPYTTKAHGHFYFDKMSGNYSHNKPNVVKDQNLNTFNSNKLRQVYPIVGGDRKQGYAFICDKQNATAGGTSCVDKRLKQTRLVDRATLPDNFKKIPPAFSSKNELQEGPSFGDDMCDPDDSHAALRYKTISKRNKLKNKIYYCAGQVGPGVIHRGV